MERAQAVAASLNASLRQKRTDTFDQSDADAARRRDPDATDFHATIPINDYPQKARWRVTNKETMVQLIENTGASVTNKGTTVWPMFSFDSFLVADCLPRCVLREGQGTGSRRPSQAASSHRVERRAPCISNLFLFIYDPY
jgi:hypothetical protein